MQAPQSPVTAPFSPSSKGGSTVGHVMGMAGVMILLLIATPFVLLGVVRIFHVLSVTSVGLIVVAAIAYGGFWALGASLNARFERIVDASLSGGRDKPSPPRNLTRAYGALLICMLPYLLFLFLLALYLVEVLVTEVLVLSDAIGGMPIIVLLGLGIVALGTVWGVIVGMWRLFVAPKPKEFGLALPADSNLHLWEVVNRVAADAGTRTASTIYMTPTAEIAVWERGSLARVLLGRGKRCMRVGMAAIHDMDTAELAAILRHEFAHFGNRDTAWGSFTFSMKRALHTAWQATPGGNPIRQRSLLGIIVCLNPAWWVYWLFVRLFYRATGGFSRLREVMADWDAITYAGGEAFACGLTKVIVNGETLDRWKKTRELEEGVIPNVADEVAALLSNMSVEESAEITESALDRPKNKTTAYQTHPAPKVRLSYARQARCESRTGVSGAARTLLDDWQALDGELSAMWLGASATA